MTCFVLKNEFSIDFCRKKCIIFLTKEGGMKNVAQLSKAT